MRGAGVKNVKTAARKHGGGDVRGDADNSLMSCKRGGGGRKEKTDR